MMEGSNIHKSVTLICVFMLVHLNKCVVVCGSDLQRGHSGDGYLSSSILFKYESSRGHLFVNQRYHNGSFTRTPP